MVLDFVTARDIPLCTIYLNALKKYFLRRIKSFITLLGHRVPNTFYMRNGDLLPQNTAVE